MNNIYYLLNAEYYPEKNLNQVITEHWKLWFPNYGLTKLLAGSQKFQPDLAAMNDRATEVILVELKKASHEKKRAVQQVVRYGKLYHAAQPRIPLRLLVIGPWSEGIKPKIISSEGYNVCALSTEYLAYQLILLLEPFLENYKQLCSLYDRRPGVDIDRYVVPTIGGQFEQK